jgi:hypothetical protein
MDTPLRLNELDRNGSYWPSAHTLQQAGLLKYARGRIQIVDLEGMQENACECYETVSRHYDLLLGVRNNK